MCLPFSPECLRIAKPFEHRPRVESRAKLIERLSSPLPMAKIVEDHKPAIGNQMIESCKSAQDPIVPVSIDMEQGDALRNGLLGEVRRPARAWMAECL